ncbi:zinc ribbon domain-containing protein [Lactococcus sp. DD01]|uniref:zinc ribbon domain-containing protein n=1 Tax=Lactococcus sp. DD01 TaxID=1776443 RepID=UPI00077667B3|nr:zinc ribbon domain-containing protein [Lactococcus sp. DD01]KXT59427.1 hypothetical protein LACDD01_02082 [Lactococcus sp. DD01]
MVKVALCQSCGVPLDTNSPRGFEKNGELSDKYCMYCYEEGKWTCDLEFDEMYKYNLKRFKESSIGGFEKIFLMMIYTKKFMRKLERWSDD